MGMAFFMLPLLLLGGGGGVPNELLDYLATSHYWQTRQITPSVDLLIAQIDAKPKAEDISALIKQLGADDFAKREDATEQIARKGPGVIPQLKVAQKSDDPEVADRAGRLIKQLSSGDIDPAVHKLMVIRTLGELKDAKAVAALKPLLESKEAFVAEYAGRAIAAIEGKQWTAPAPDAAAYEKDLWLMPKGVKLVAQMTASPAGTFDWAPAIKAFRNPFGDQKNPDEIMKEVQTGVMMALNLVGNARIEGLTFGLSADPGENSGFMVAIVRGQYNRDKVADMARTMNVPIIDVEGYQTVAPDDHMRFILVSDQQLVLVGGPNAQAMPVKEIAAALKAGKGTLSEDAEMVALLGGIDRKSGGWAGALMTPTYKQVPWFEPVQAITLTRKVEKEKTHFTLTAKGKDQEAMAEALGKFNNDLGMARAELQQQAAQGGGFVPKPLVDFVSSIKAEQRGNDVIVTGTLAGSPADMIGGMLFPMMMFGH